MVLSAATPPCFWIYFPRTHLGLAARLMGVGCVSEYLLQVTLHAACPWHGIAASTVSQQKGRPVRHHLSFIHLK